MRYKHMAQSHIEDMLDRCFGEYMETVYKEKWVYNPVRVSDVALACCMLLEHGEFRDNMLEIWQSRKQVALAEFKRVTKRDFGM